MEKLSDEENELLNHTSRYLRESERFFWYLYQHLYTTSLSDKISNSVKRRVFNSCYERLKLFNSELLIMGKGVGLVEKEDE